MIEGHQGLLYGEAVGMTEGGTDGIDLGGPPGGGRVFDAGVPAP